MRFLSLLFICTLTCTALTASAQGFVVGKALRQSSNLGKAVSATKQYKTILPLLNTTHIERTVHQAAIANLRRSVLTVQANPQTKHKGSAFAVNIDGKVWGVTARHVMDDINHTPYLTFLGENGEPVILLAEPSKKGTAAGADVALFKIPQEALPYIQPLELAEDLPPVHSVLSSSGFASGNFFSQPEREVLFASEHRILTKYAPFIPQANGYCGAPLLLNGKVAGVHVGSLMANNAQTADWYAGTLGQFSAPMHNISLAVPASWLRKLARQAEGVYTPQEGVPLVFNGLQIMLLQPTDSIGFIMQLRDGRVIKTLSRYPFMDFNHLENFFDIHPGDTFRLEISSIPAHSPSAQRYWYEWTDGENAINIIKR